MNLDNSRSLLWPLTLPSPPGWGRGEGEGAARGLNSYFNEVRSFPGNRRTFPLIVPTRSLCRGVNSSPQQRRGKAEGRRSPAEIQTNPRPPTLPSPLEGEGRVGGTQGAD